MNTDPYVPARHILAVTVAVVGVTAGALMALCGVIMACELALGADRAGNAWASVGRLAAVTVPWLTFSAWYLRRYPTAPWRTRD